MPNVSVGAIIEKDGKILLTKRNVKPFKGAWVIPGGHIEQYEKAEDAVKREVREETGLNIKEAKINEESLEFGWFEPKMALKLKLGFRNKEIISQWLEQN